MKPIFLLIIIILSSIFLLSCSNVKNLNSETESSSIAIGRTASTLFNKVKVDSSYSKDHITEILSFSVSKAVKVTKNNEQSLINQATSSNFWKDQSYKNAKYVKTEVKVDKIKSNNAYKIVYLIDTDTSEKYISLQTGESFEGDLKIGDTYIIYGGMLFKTKDPQLTLDVLVSAKKA